MRQSDQCTQTPVDNDQFAAASNTFWLQREALSVLQYRLVAEKLILGSGSTGWLVNADADVRAAIGRVQGGELVRAVEVDALLRELGLDGATSLGQIAEVAPGPWATVLRDHRGALRALAFGIRAIAAENLRLLEAGAKAIQETFAGAGPDGHYAQVSAVTVTHQAALQTIACVRQLSLLEFLR